MSRMLLSPDRYHQGAGAITKIGAHAARLGDSALVIGGKTVLSVVYTEEGVFESLGADLSRG